MRTIFWGFRLLIFLFLLAFAAKNTDPVNVRFFFDILWEAPLVVVLLAFFAGGALLGMLSLVGTIFGLRRKIAAAKRDAERDRALLAEFRKERETRGVAGTA
ncbi:MAG: LapA family protein [Candidatus Accumulibacter sp.]|jgi:uncharacterized integral membrane protein|nr:LapA family protein [Accumulibacter sp.]